MRFARTRPARRRPPEVVQTSAMDCGPAALKCLLSGFGIRASYGRLREACQTEVDGTSIDTLQDVAIALGLDAEQVLLPNDSLLHSRAPLLPGLAVVLQPLGFTHFVVVWRGEGGSLSVMDPASGRRRQLTAGFGADLYQHEMQLPVDVWREFATTDAFLEPLAGRLADVGVTDRRFLDDAAHGPDWRSLAAVDAATRFAAEVVRCGAIRRGREADRLVRSAVERELAGSRSDAIIPEHCRSVRAMENEPGRVLARGAVLLRVLGPTNVVGPTKVAATRPGEPPPQAAPPLPPELRAALDQPKDRPLRWLLQTALERPARAAGLALLAVASGVLVVLEGLLLAGWLSPLAELPSGIDRLMLTIGLFAWLAATSLFEPWVFRAVRRLGRALEVRFHRDLLEKIPRLHDRYFASRPIADLAERAFSIRLLHGFPGFVASLLRFGGELVAVAVALCAIDPASAPFVVATSAACVLVPWILSRGLVEPDQRLRSHAGALGRMCLDALLGLLPLRSHGARAGLEREHSVVLAQWSNTARALRRRELDCIAAELVVCGAGALFLVVMRLPVLPKGPIGLLFLYWTLRLPGIARSLAESLRLWPQLKNATTRVLEPLGAIEATSAAASETAPSAPTANGVRLEFDGLSVHACGHTILDGVDVTIPAGQHVAIVGASGAGKSSLVGVLLGWHVVSAGEVRIDGAPLDGATLERLRADTAWVDPAVRLWNKSLLENLEIGELGAAGTAEDFEPILAAAGLTDLPGALPDGLASRIGDDGRSLSGGEGQRVRFARALARGRARLVILDEAFRGLDRARRKEMFVRARSAFAGATLLFVTHDVDHALDCDRVLVLDRGRVVEDGRPVDLAADRASRFHEMLEGRRAASASLQDETLWRRVHVEAGRVTREAS